MKRNKFVLDVNIWVSIILGKQTAWLVNVIENFKIEIVSSIELYSELKDVLNRPKFKKYVTPFDINEALVLHTKLCKQFKNIKIVPTFTDSDDDYLLALAIKAKATYIVTGDKLILNTHIGNVITIISFSQFKSMLI